MGTRIYKLAKELGMETKDLIELCNRLGIENKSTGLASLSDEEVALVRDYLSGKKSTPAAGQEKAAVEEPARQEPGTLRREDYIPPPGALPKEVPLLSLKPKAAQEKEKPETEKREPAAKPKADKSAPIIKLAPLPKAPPETAKPSTPVAEKPVKPEEKPRTEPPRRPRATRPLSEYLRKFQLAREAELLAAQQKAAPPDEAKVAAETRPTVSEEKRDETATVVREKERRKAKKAKRGKAAAEEEEEEEFARAGRDQRLLRRKREQARREKRKAKAITTEEEEEEEAPQQEVVVRRTLRHLQRTRGVSTAAPRKTKVVVELPCTVRSFSEAVGVPVAQVQAKLLELGVLANINTTLDPDVAELLAESLNLDVELRREVDLEEKLKQRFEQPDDPDQLVPRPPVITFLGHVDHGKTSLLDKILGLDVAAREKGGITQHIRAYQIEHGGRKISFVDTPGHEAFTALRARGAHCTDIAVLVVAADDGVMPQTEEAIAHARAANVPIVVALNKMDLPSANPDRVLQQLAAQNLLPAEWGGDIEVVRTSAVTGQGIDELLDTVLTLAELHELKANPNRPASGVCLEASVQPGRGVVAKLLVQRGTLRVGDVVLCGTSYGRVKALFDTLDPNKRHQEAGPSMPVDMTGLEEAPPGGERFYVLDDISEARQIAQERAARQRMAELAERQPHITLETLFERLGKSEEVATLNLIVRADVQGSLDAIRKELEKLKHPEVEIKILQASVGGITEADVELANASDAVIIGFNVVPSEKARQLADKYGVQIRRYDIIYQLTDDLKAALEGMLKPEQREVELGRAAVLQTFRISKVGTVAGCRVLQGIVARDARVRVIRDSRVIGDYAIESLKRHKDDVREVREGYECGIKLAGFNDVKEGDTFEVYRIEEVKRHLD